MKFYNKIKLKENQETTQGDKLIQIDTPKYPKLELIEIEGNLLNGKTILINSEGMLSGSLRNAKDGCTYFGFSKYRVNPKNNI